MDDHLLGQFGVIALFDDSYQFSHDRRTEVEAKKGIHCD